MKKLFFTILCGILFISLNAQNDYKVIRINGTIVIQKSSTALIHGSVFNENDELEFKTTNARAAVINPGKGRFILMPNNNNIAYAKANLTPSMSNISSRAGGIINKLDLTNYFSGNCVIIDKIELKINSKEYPMDENNFFFIRYNYKEESIPKKLSFRNDTLIIDKSELFTVDGWPIPNPNVYEMEILYRQEEQKTNVLINTFNPVFPENDELKREIEIILEAVETLTKAEKFNEVLSYINDMYGKPNNDNIEKWLDDNFKL